MMEVINKTNKKIATERKQTIMKTLAIKSLVLFWFCSVTAVIAQQTYTDSEIGFDAYEIAQRLRQKNIPEETITTILDQERIQLIQQYEQQLQLMEVAKQEQRSNSEIRVFQSVSPTLANAQTGCVPESEKQALIDLYNAVGGATSSLGWDVINTEPCSWNGVSVLNGNVRRLELAFQNSPDRPSVSDGLL